MCTVVVGPQCVHSGSGASMYAQWKWDINVCTVVVGHQCVYSGSGTSMCAQW